MTPDVANSGALEMLLAVLGAGVLSLGLGLWLMLPRGDRRGFRPGVLLAAVGIGLFASQFPLLTPWTSGGLFYLLAVLVLGSAIATITSRNPVYSAIWFAMSLLATAGLFLFQGAQFLGVATIVVYAGAILVTFLFVLMLAQPRGQAYYDRLSWAPLLAALTGGTLIGALALGMVTVFHSPNAQIAVPDPALLTDGILGDQHVARLCAWLFSKYLISTEVAGTLLLAALVGAVAIAAGLYPERKGRVS